MELQAKIGIVLSGGGARGIAHIGALKALEEKGIFPEVISGTSAGAIAGSLYAYGYTPDDMIRIIKEVRYLRSLRSGIGWMGLISSTAMHNVLTRYMPGAEFSSLKKKLFVCLAHLRTGTSRFISEGDLVTAVTASSAIPVMMTPVKLGDELYVDGGVVNNFPIEPLESLCRPILGVSVNPVLDEIPITSMRKVAERTFMIAIYEHSKPRMGRTDWLVEPRALGNFGLLDVRKADTIFQIGYEATLRKLEEQNPLNGFAKAL